MKFVIEPRKEKRSLFEELMEGVDAMKQRLEGKVMLQTHIVTSGAGLPVRGLNAQAMSA